jgi:hypothetical protein
VIGWKAIGFIVNNSGNIASTRVKGGMPVIVFAPRKGKLVLYLEQKLIQFSELLEKLGKHTTSKACLYIKRLNDVMNLCCGSLSSNCTDEH